MKNETLCCSICYGTRLFSVSTDLKIPRDNQSVILYMMYHSSRNAPAFLRGNVVHKGRNHSPVDNQKARSHVRI